MFVEASNYQVKITKTIICIFEIIHRKRVINIGGKTQSVYNFAKKYNPKIKKIYSKKVLGKNSPINVSMNIDKFNKLIND